MAEGTVNIKIRADKANILKRYANIERIIEHEQLMCQTLKKITSVNHLTDLELYQTAQDAPNGK
jgi:hypothetical protein